jgi:hypothetical protein
MWSLCASLRLVQYRVLLPQILRLLDGKGLTDNVAQKYYLRPTWQLRKSFLVELQPAMPKRWPALRLSAP